ncbi:UNVERIFIED_CONTAM: hypothetical protein Scaly_0172300 [Sesamum calycinum]|uniref:MULE transposase domain-containing protein n=1 Tax=Sesamum calycinum TaxID=2727403 RepID=A0AAW2SXB9_9LAMI
MLNVWGGCEWRLNALKLGDQSTFQIREYNPKHKCGKSFHVKNVNSKWLSRKYEESFRTDPNRNVKGFRKDIIKDIRCHVSKHQAYRAKRKALNAIEVKQRISLINWDYAAELRASNPRSTVIIAMTEGDDGTDRRKFEKLYVCFDALRQGFLHGCRPVIGVDGCHLKGPHGGILLTVVSIDLNNNLYPLAYAVVSGETRESWEWFLELLKGDLNVVRDDTYTFISDKQKVVIPAFESVFPGATNRFCDFVNPCYSVETFLEVYKHAILPVNGPQLWTKTGLIPPLPPNFGRRSGRPSRVRRVEHDEPVNKGKKRQRGQDKQPIRLKRQPYQVMCHYFGGIGHNQKGCERKKIDHPTTSQDANSNDQTTATKLTARKMTAPPQNKQKKAAHSQPQSKKRKGVEVQATHTTSSANVPSRTITRSTPLPAATEPNQATTIGGTQPLLHRFTQCSTVQNASSSGVPYLTQGGKKFVTMKNLTKVVAAKKKNIALQSKKYDADL